MEKKEFKKLFGDVAKSRGFHFIHGFWYIESEECIITLELQKSNYSDLYYLNIETFVHGLFGEHYVKNKALLRKVGTVSLRPPSKYKNFLDLEVITDLQESRQGFESLFDEYILPFASQGLSRKGILELPDAFKVGIPGIAKEALGLV